MPTTLYHHTRPLVASPHARRFGVLISHFLYILYHKNFFNAKFFRQESKGGSAALLSHT